MAEQSSGNSSLDNLLKAKSEEIESLQNEIMKLNSLLQKRNTFCPWCNHELPALVPAESAKSVPTEVGFKSIQTSLCQCSPYVNLVAYSDVETQTFETDFLEIDTSSSAADWIPPEGSDYTVADLVKQVVELQSEESDYVYDEKYNMYFSPSTGYYFDTEKNLLYDPRSQTYYAYNKESNGYEFHSQVELQHDAYQSTSSEAMDAPVNVIRGYTQESETSAVEDGSAKQKSKKKIPKTSPLDNNSVIGGAELNNVDTTTCITVDSDKDDESSLEEGELGSPYTESTTTEGSYYLSSVGSPASANFDDDSSENWPPCIRLIVEESSKLQIGSLLLITCTGAVVGRDKNCRLCIPDVSVSKIHAETLYNNETCEYYVTDLGSQNGTFVNSTRLSQAKEKSSPHVLKHGDHVRFGFCKLLAHIHPGTETCDECEPGQVQAKHTDQSDKHVPLIQTKEEKEKERRHQLRQLKKKFGLQRMNYEQDGLSVNPPGTNYHDRAKERQKTKGSDNPYEKTAEPVSLDVTLPSDNKGYQLLKKMGWKEGQGLGAKTAGETQPVPISVRSNRAGLGSTSTNRSEVPLNPRNRKWRKAQRRYYEAEKTSSSSFRSDARKFAETDHET